MHKTDYFKITRYLKEIIQNTEYEGHVYVVGGAVRSEIMDENIKDIDLVVDLPNGGIGLANWLKDNGYVSGSVVVYPTYGTAMFHLDKFKEEEIEVVHTRKEQYKDKNSRNPETEYGTIQEDAMRRDLTINALYYNVSTEKYLDVTGNGYKDILDGLVRVTSTPEIVFCDDALRILRCVRFATRYDFEIDDETLMGMKINISRLSTITTERINDEFSKILMCGKAWKGLKTLFSLGAFDYIFKSNSTVLETYTDESYRNEVIQTIKDRCRFCYSEENRLLYDNELVNRLAILLYDFIPSDIEKLLKGMRYSNDIIDSVLKRRQAMIYVRLKFLWSYRMSDVYKYEYKFGYADCVSAFDCAISMYKMQHPFIDHRNILLKFKELRDDIWFRGLDNRTMCGFQLPINGEDIMREKNISPGKDVKNYMFLLMEMIFEMKEPYKVTREQCLNMLQHITKENINAILN